MSSEPKPLIALFLRPVEIETGPSGYYHQILTFVTVTETNGARDVESVQYSRRELSDLEIYCQGNNSDGPGRKSYAWKVDGKPYSVDRATAERLLKVLTKIDKGLDRLKEERGYPATYGEFVQRIAEVLKVKHYARRATTERIGQPYHLGTIGDLRSEIERRENAWRESAETPKGDR